MPLGKRGKIYDPHWKVGYANGPMRLFLRAIQEEVQEAVESLRDQVALPLLESMDPPPARKPRRVRPFISLSEDHADPPPSRLLQLRELRPLMDQWLERWHLDHWIDETSSERFRYLLGTILEQWEAGYFAGVEERPLYRVLGSAAMRPYPWWFPQDRTLPELPWSQEEVDAILPPQPGMMSFREEYRNYVSKDCMDRGAWSPQLDLVSRAEIASFEDRRREVYEAAMTPPPCFPVYDPSQPERPEGAPSWDDRVKTIAKKYKARVEDALLEAGRLKTPPREDPRYYQWLARKQLLGDSYYRMAQEDGAPDRRNISDHVRRVAETVGIDLRR